jgi:spore germination cell wall hydrolase CwlJ-like protein
MTRIKGKASVVALLIFNAALLITILSQLLIRIQNSQNPQIIATPDPDFIIVEPATAQILDPVQVLCLSMNVYFEARGESLTGKIAVAQVTMNRVTSGRFGEGVCGVVYQQNNYLGKIVCQFSWVCETTHKIRPIYPALYRESEEVAKKVLLENFRLSTMRDALYFHGDYVNPNWGKKKISQIGRHIFYKD